MRVAIKRERAGGRWGGGGATAQAGSTSFLLPRRLLFGTRDGPGTGCGWVRRSSSWPRATSSSSSISASSCRFPRSESSVKRALTRLPENGGQITACARAKSGSLLALDAAAAEAQVLNPALDARTRGQAPHLRFAAAQEPRVLPAIVFASRHDFPSPDGAEPTIGPLAGFDTGVCAQVSQI
jgi:hypothetical protein